MARRRRLPHAPGARAAEFIRSSECRRARPVMLVVRALAGALRRDGIIPPLAYHHAYSIHGAQPPGIAQERHYVGAQGVRPEAGISSSGPTDRRDLRLSWSGL